MTAQNLLATIEARGGVATIKGQGDTASINVAPRSLALELLPDLQRFKPSLLELLEKEQQEVGELARTILECRRPDAGFDFGKLRPFWRAAIELTGVEMDSAQLGQWAKANTNSCL